jgi:hypothetical protein
MASNKAHHATGFAAGVIAAAIVARRLKTLAARAGLSMFGYC